MSEQWLNVNDLEFTSSDSTSLGSFDEMKFPTNTNSQSGSESGLDNSETNVDEQTKNSLITSNSRNSSLNYDGGSIQIQENVNKKKENFDKYGFLLEGNLKAIKEKQFSQGLIHKEVERTMKWQNIITNWDKHMKKKQKLYHFFGEGIPDRFRGLIWIKLSGSIKQIEEHANTKTYQQLFEIKNKNAEIDIAKDLDRTFPKHQEYMKNKEQLRLFRLLLAWSNYDTGTQYCQGMNFVAATLLLFLEEEQAFWTFVVLMTDYHMSGIYQDGFPLLQVYKFQFEQLMKKYLPKLFKHFTNVGIGTDLYYSKWLLSMLYSSFSFNTVIRFFDCFLLEGTPYYFQFPLTLLKWKQKAFLSMGLEELMENLINFPDKSLDLSKIIKTCQKFKITTKMLAQWSDEFRRQNYKRSTNTIN
ncbi:usp6 n-terminal-like protein [Anaeramoeba flamelloides]|uniref:Usp6 n-terminal-like protein n=1 Tax=Anaeramoeba flamelloides TaxID=1746091 RepID=A0AAV8A105_9EUKA|nr:usp6 n-terminal-like protein [Anaeramoeba flamelloides]KAJ6228677.1 usp6 n-terminal-like protein [Anaeramoeba flamelloides]